MFTAALFTIAEIRKQPKCSLTDEWIKKFWHIYMYVYIYIYICIYIHTHIHTYIYIHTHTMDYYSAIKKNKILPFAATWMDLKGIMLSEVSQTKKENTV